MAASDDPPSDVRSNRRLNWLTRPPSTKQGDPWHAFRSVSYRWVNDNPNSRENVARAVLEALFAKPFPKARPTFLRNPQTNRCLELDMWNEELKIGVEFNGVQHVQFPNPFHSTYKQFVAQRKRDALKIQLCKEHNVKLIIISHMIQRTEIESFLRNHLQHELEIHKSVSRSANPEGVQTIQETDNETDVLLFARLDINDQEKD